MYSVARRAFTAGEPGKRTAKMRDVKVEDCGEVARLWALRSCTIGHFCDTGALVRMEMSRARDK
jgi:hypothetical protein